MKLPGYFIYVIMLVPVWSVASGSVHPVQLAIGALWALATVPIASKLLRLPKRGDRLVPWLARLARFVGYSLTSFVPQAFRSSLDMAYRVVKPSIPMRPGIVAVPIEAKSDISVLFIVNHVILTPGQLVVDIDGERRIVYVHSIDVGDPERLKRELVELFARAEAVLE